MSIVRASRPRASFQWWTSCLLTRACLSLLWMRWPSVRGRGPSPAFAASLPVVGVSTLASVALAAADTGGEGRWLVALDARMDQVYAATYDVAADDRVSVISADGLYDPDQVPVADAARAVGDGQHYAALRELLPAAAWLADVAPRAGTVARLARHKWLAGDTMAAEDAQPVYLRDRVIQGAVR